MNGKRGWSLLYNKDAEGLDGSLVLFSMLLYDGLLGVFSAIAFSFDDRRSAIVLSAAGMTIFFGLVCHIILGFNRYLRFYYGLCGVMLFCYLIARGGSDISGLFGALGMVYGFVIVLGWRLAAWFLCLLALFVMAVFFQDAYLEFGRPFPLIVEIKFFVAFVGIALLALGYGYVVESRIESLQRYGRKMSSLAFKDEMTDLPNRRSTEEFLSQRWEEYRRSDYLFAVLLCNLDDFKELNNQYGSGFGDGVLLRVANILTRGLRNQDIVSRWGGDEFLVILPGQDYQTALKVAERVRSRVEKIELVMRGRPVAVTVSVGVASVENALSPDDLVGIAESGLYQAKNMGKNRVMLG